MAEILETELATYGERRDELLATHENQFVLIHANEVLGTFDTDKDAVRQGYSLLGNVPFLVKQVLRVERPETFVSNLIAI